MKSNDYYINQSTSLWHILCLLQEFYSKSKQATLHLIHGTQVILYGPSQDALCEQGKNSY